jgi:hypothetical protein
LVPKTSSMNLDWAKWVFYIKHKVDDIVDRYKARLDTKGFHQQEVVDFFETQSCCKPITSLAISVGCCIKQIDVSNAFLHEIMAILQDTVYMTQPPSFVHLIYPDAVCLLKKALYGLKQAPRTWYNKLSSRLLELGF